MQDLKITLIQSDLFWEDKKANLQSFSKKIEAISGKTDIIMLPEMFTTGFSMNAESLGEDMNGETISWMRNMSAKKNAVLTGSFICGINGQHFNRLVWMRPDGSYSTYDKRHLFSMGDEHNHYTHGSSKILEEVNGWKVLPLICYDLRFPVWSRRTKKENYDLLLYTANWPERRVHAWRSLQIARAIENQCYVAGLNRTGNDGNGIYHSGDSLVIDPKGEIISRIKSHEAATETIVLDYAQLQDFRAQFPVINDADEFTIREK